MQQSKYRKQLKGRQGQSSIRVQGQIERRGNGVRETADRAQQREEGDKIDAIFGFNRYTEGNPRLGWLLNYLPTTMPDETGLEKSGMDLYFIDREGGNFKCSIFCEPYFYVDLSDHRRLLEVSQYLLRKFEGTGCRVQQIEKEDLDLPNHLSGKKRKLLKVSFGTVKELVDAKSSLWPVIRENQKRTTTIDYFDDSELSDEVTKLADDPSVYLADLREYDVPYAMRTSIDLGLRVGAWYVVTPEPYGASETCNVEWQKDMLELCEPRILAFDIECEKSPLKFPSAEVDRIFMISYMVSGHGYLIINREIVSEDIEDFEYTPLPKYPGPFHVMNEKNEESMLRRFIEHVQELKPHVIVTYNGDFFDWPYVEQRCSKYNGLSLYNHLGIRSTSSDQKGGGEYVGRCVVHLDAFCWVQRDSYLPQGNQGLKAVTRNKLGYDPIEVDPEDMVRFAKENPAYMASYSVSDAVATYYLYTTYVHNFIFSLSTIIPMGPEDVLRKGSGTLCEALLMVQAYEGNIICPNKQVDPLESFHQGHLLESETYIGGHVECLEAGVFRADLKYKFSLIPTALQQLIDRIDRDLTFTLEIEHGLQRSDVQNYDEVRQAIVEKLEMLRDSPNREEEPAIYHLDVGAMYPNIILTNRLQPSAMVSAADCAACEFNRAENGCKRPMKWTWRGEYSPATQNEYQSVKRQLTYEKMNDGQTFSDLSEKDQSAKVKERLKAYSHRVYRKTKVTEIQERVNTVCMRENSFYVDTVKAFRDRRYDYKLLTKTWKGKKSEAEKKGDVVARKAAEDKEVLMDSLQLAHKCILNSFYGYVMRKGARWRSMEMAGIVTHTGAKLIMQARELVEQVGRPLELDTDGIWCILPSSFPQDFKFRMKNGGKSISVGYPCAMLNADVHDRYTNHQYQELAGPRKYASHSECSIFFELDGPYKAMILPASPEEGRLLKKKYVVFNFDGTIAELKGFELKRRGELELVKIFQSQVFEHFLAGNSLEECYKAVGTIANQWLDVLDDRGYTMDDDELLELISERKTISKTLEEYGTQKSTSITTANRLADFLGPEMVKDKGLNCNLIISRLPAGAPVTERAIPVAIFSCEPGIRRYYLKKWLKDSALDCDDFRNVVDWDYYKDRLSKTVQKIITIPAGVQRINNPCPRVEHPIWLQRVMNEKASGKKQMSIKDSFKAMLLAPKSYTESNSKKPTSSCIESSNHGPSRNDDKGETSNATADIEDCVSANAGITKIPMIRSKRQADWPANSATDLSGSNNFLTKVNDGSPASVIGLNSPHAKINEVYPMNEEKPATIHELQSWVMNRKANWKLIRKAKRDEKDASRRYGQLVPPVGSTKRAVGVRDFVRSAALATTFGCWQIIELQELETPGDFVIWALIGNSQLQKMRITIARTIYVNVCGRDAAAAANRLGGQQVVKELPRSRQVHDLYEINIPERKFLRSEKALHLFLCDSQVEGVYETHTPLWLRAVLRMGCLSKLKNDKMRGVSNDAYKLQDLDMVNSAVHPYLDHTVASYKRIFLYYASDKNRPSADIGILTLFVIETSNKDEIIAFEAMKQDLLAEKDNDNSSIKEVSSLPLSGKAFVWQINSGVNALKSSWLSRTYRRYQPLELANIQFFVQDVSTVNKNKNEAVSGFKHALSLCNRQLANYLSERHGPTIVIAQSAGITSQAQWRQMIPMLHDFPVAVMSGNTTDDSFPAIGWQVYVAERMIQRLLLFPQWFNDRLNCARYSSIPVCNLGADCTTTMIDVIFARQLQHNRHLLWASEDKVPDLGGSERDFCGYIWTEDLVEPVICTPGVYRNYCVELDLFGLTVCAILSSGELDAEGLTSVSVSIGNKSNRSTEIVESMIGNDSPERNNVTGVNYSDGNNVSTDVSCGRAFNVLKAIVAQCIADVSKSGNPISDGILTAIYRYLCGYGSGLLVDSALHKIIYGLMCKLFKKLVNGLRRLGTKIIHADFSRIIIDTNKKSLDSAQEYVEFIIDTITQKSVFAYLEINVKSFWEQLIWLGPQNFGGMLPGLSSETMADNQSQDVTNECTFHTSNTKNIHFATAAAEAVWQNNSNEELGMEKEFDFLDDEKSVESQRTDVRDHSKDIIHNSREVPESVSEDGENISLASEDNDALVSEWNIVKYLPQTAAHYFRQIVGRFLKEYDVHWQELSQRKELAVSATYASEKGNRSANELVDVDEEKLEELVLGHMREVIANNMTTEILKMVDNLQQIYSLHPNGHKHRGHPAISHSMIHTSGDSTALDFVKAVCHVLALDPKLKESVEALKRMLLTQLHVREFDEASKFRDPCNSYLLKDIICSYCSTCRNFDLLQDPWLTRDLEDESNRWICQFCSHQLNKEEIENRIIDEVERSIQRYLLQDFRCPQTKMVSRLFTATHSAMCKPLIMDYSPTDMTSLFAVILQTSVSSFQWLSFIFRLFNGYRLPQGNILITDSVEWDTTVGKELIAAYNIKRNLQKGVCP